MSVLKTLLSTALALAVIGAAVVGGTALGVPGLIGQADATATGTSNAATVEVTGQSQNGQVESFKVAGQAFVEYENLPKDAQTAYFTLEVYTDGEWETVTTETKELDGAGSDGSVSFDHVEGQALDETSLTADDFSEDDDGETRTETLPVRVTVVVEDSDGNRCVYQQKHTIKTVVSNLNDPDVSGESGVDGYLDMNDHDSDCEDCEDGNGADHHDFRKHPTPTDTDAYDGHDEDPEETPKHEDHDHKHVGG